MSEDVIRPMEYQRSSMVESSVLEGIRNVVSRIADALSEIRASLEDAARGMVEAVKIRSERLWNARYDIEQILDEHHTHFIRTRMGLENRDLYAESFNALRTALASLTDISNALSSIAMDPELRREKLLSFASQIVEELRSSISSLIESTMILLDNPRHGCELLRRAISTEREVERIYRSSIIEAQALENPLMRALLSLSRSITTLARSLEFIGLQKV